MFGFLGVNLSDKMSDTRIDDDWIVFAVRVVDRVCWWSVGRQPGWEKIGGHERGGLAASLDAKPPGDENHHHYKNILEKKLGPTPPTTSSFSGKKRGKSKKRFAWGHR